MPSFDGTDEKYQLWWLRFKAFANVHRFGQALEIGGEMTMPTREDTVLDRKVASEKASIDARERNMVAMANLSMALTTDGDISLIYESYTTEWLNGQAHLVVKSLTEKYKPMDQITKVELRQKLNELSMGE